VHPQSTDKALDISRHDAYNIESLFLKKAPLDSGLDSSPKTGRKHHLSPMMCASPSPVDETPRRSFVRKMAGGSGSDPWPENTDWPDTPATSEASEWQLSLSKVRILPEDLGAGKYGVVRRANWRGTPVAIKLLHDSSMYEDKALFVKELRMMASLHHPNIVQFLGFVLLPDLAIVMELFPERSVQNYVEKHKWLYYSTARRFCYEMALGVGYLHGRKPQMLIHRDIKPSNYMLTGR